MELPTKGSLSEVSFIEILKDASASTMTGMIRLETGSVIKVVYLQNGTIAFASSNEKSDRLTEVLKRAGKLTLEQIEHAQARIKPNVSLGKTLVELGYISSKDLLWGARMQVEGILYQLLFWKQGTYQVLEGPLPKEIVSLGLTIPQVIFNGILQIQDRDWILQHIGSPEAIYVVRPDFEERNAIFGLPVEDVVSKMNGQRSLEEIAQGTGSDTFEVCKMVAALDILELAEVQHNKPVQMPLVAAETLDQEPISVEPEQTAESSSDISLGQVLQIPTVEELTEEPKTHDVPEESSFDADQEIEATESDRSVVEEEPAYAPVKPVYQEPSHVTASNQEPFVLHEEAIEDSEYDEASVEEGGGWKKVVLIIAILSLVAAAAAFYYLRKPDDTSNVSANSKVVPKKDSGTQESTVRTEPAENPPIENNNEPGDNNVTQKPTLTPPSPEAVDSPRKLAAVGMLSKAAAQWKRELSKNRNRLTIQVEIACQDRTVMEALNLFGSESPLYVVPMNFRGQSCYRVLYGVYNSEALAQNDLAKLPSEFLQQPSPPKVISISKALQ